MKKLEKILSLTIFTVACTLFSGCSERVNLNYKSPKNKIINLYRNEEISTQARFFSTTDRINVSKTINGTPQNLSFQIIGDSRTYYIDIEEELMFENLGFYNLNYHVSNPQDSDNANWEINVINYRPKIIFNNDESISIIKISNPNFSYKIDVIDEDEVDLPLDTNVELKFHNNPIKKLDLEGILNFDKQGTFQIDITSSDGNDISEKIVEIVYSNNNFFDYSKDYNDENGILNIDDIPLFSEIIGKYYSNKDIRLIRKWNTFFNDSLVFKIIYDGEEKSLDYLSDNYGQTTLISSYDKSLVDSLEELSGNFSNSKLENILINFVPENSKILKNALITFEDDLGVFKDLNVDYNISYSGNILSIKSNPNEQELILIENYKKLYGKEIIIMRNDEMVFDSLIKLYDYFD